MPTTFSGGVCEVCGGEDRYKNGLCQVCSTEREQVERNELIDCIAGRGKFKSIPSGLIAFEDHQPLWGEVADMVSCGILHILAEGEADKIKWMRVNVTSAYLEYLEEKELKNMPTIKIYGRSDDLVEIEGEITDEFNFSPTRSEQTRLIAISDGTLLRIGYDEDAIWRITRIALGSSVFQKTEGSVIEDTPDVVILTGDDLQWVVMGSQSAMAGRVK